MSKKQKVVFTLISVTIALSLFLIIKKKNSSANDNDHFSIAVVTWVNHGPFYLAKEKGFYKKHGLEVDIQKIEDMTARRAALLSGNLDGIISSVDALSNGAAIGIKAKTVMKLGAGNGSDAIVSKSDITTIKELKGRTVAFEKGTPSHLFLLLALEKDGLSSKDIKPVYMTAGDSGAAFVAGKVDACVTWEPWVTTAKEKGKGNVLITSENMQGILVDTFIVRNEVLQSKPIAIKAFLNGWFDAIEYWKKYPDESNKIMADALGISIGDMEAMLQTVILSDYQDNLEYFGSESKPGQYWDVFNAANRIWKEEGIIENAIDPKLCTDLSFLLSIDRKD